MVKVKGSNLKQYVIMDLDGTLACGKHRLHLLPTENYHITASWIPFNKACPDDAPIWDNIEVCNSLYKSYIVIILTGRSDDAEKETVEWLAKHGVKYHYLVMRKADDNRKDTVIKEEFLKSLGIENILCAFDDSEAVIRHFRSLGVTTYQVCEYEDCVSKQSHGSDA